MSTNGVYGFYKNGINKLTYNHSDSYPSYLGDNIVSFINKSSFDEMNDIFDRIILVDQDEPASDKAIRECHQYCNISVSNGDIANWYCLLRGTQGDLFAYKNGLRYMIDSQEFIKYSLFCEWGYIINLDTNMLEIYKGGQKTPQNNRYIIDTPFEGYYNCKLLKEMPLNAIPYDWLDVINNLRKVS